jgi:hypothetical protein
MYSTKSAIERLLDVVGGESAAPDAAFDVLPCHERPLVFTFGVTQSLLRTVPSKMPVCTAQLKRARNAAISF